MIGNPINSLYLENGNTTTRINSDSFTNDVKSAVSMGFYFQSTLLFGLPELEDTLILKNTFDSPYELFATD